MAGALGEYLGFQVGQTLGALVLVFLLSRLVRKLWHDGDGRWHSIAPGFATGAFMALWLGWASASGGEPRWIWHLAAYGLSGVLVSLLDLARDRDKLKTPPHPHP